MAEMLTGQRGQTENNLHRNCFACGSNDGIGLTECSFYKGRLGWMGRRWQVQRANIEA